MFQQTDRLPPAMPIGSYKTYNIGTPLETHWTATTCEQVDCEQWREGWALRVEGVSEEDLHLARTSGRRWRQYDVGPGETWLVFEPGQPCFAAGTHMRRLERPEVFATRRGDWRGDPTNRGLRVLGAQSWVDDCGENQESVADWIEKHG